MGAAAGRRRALIRRAVSAASMRAGISSTPALPRASSSPSCANRHAEVLPTYRVCVPWFAQTSSMGLTEVNANRSASFNDHAPAAGGGDGESAPADWPLGLLGRRPQFYAFDNGT